MHQYRDKRQMAVGDKMPWISQNNKESLKGARMFNRMECFKYWYVSLVDLGCMSNGRNLGLGCNTSN